MPLTDSKFYSNAPVLFQDTRTLARFMDPAEGLAPMVQVNFELTLCTLFMAESQAKVINRHTGETLHSGSRYNDYYGPLTSLRETFEDAQTLVGRFGVTPGGPLQVVIETEISNPWVVPLPAEKHASAPAYVYLPHGWMFANQEVIDAYLALPFDARFLPENEELAKAYRALSLREQDMKGAHVVWTSDAPADVAAIVNFVDLVKGLLGEFPVVDLDAVLGKILAAHAGVFAPAALAFRGDGLAPIFVRLHTPSAAKEFQDSLRLMGWNLDLKLEEIDFDGVLEPVLSGALSPANIEHLHKFDAVRMVLARMPNA